MPQQQGGMGQGMGQGMGMGQDMAQGKHGMMKHRRMGHGRGMGMGGMHGMMAGGGMPPGMMLMLFTLMDTDGNESLSMEEVLRPHERMFNRIDADDSGELTLEEMQDFMQKMHGG